MSHFWVSVWLLRFVLSQNGLYSLVLLNMRAILLIDVQPTINASRRKAREAFLIYRGKTLSPEGINRKNER